MDKKEKKFTGASQLPLSTIKIYSFKQTTATVFGFVISSSLKSRFLDMACPVLLLELKNPYRCVPK